jgi:hypothetical protein
MSSEALEKVKQLRKKHSREVLSEYIRVQTSDLYDHHPARATLTTIAFLQVNDENAAVPAESQFKGDYTGWCYASQEYISHRVGKSLRQTIRDLELFEQDGVVITREWHDSHGYPHKEYHVVEDVVTAHQREVGDRRPKRNNRVYKANKGSFSSTNQPKSHMSSQPLPRDMSAVTHMSTQPSTHMSSQPSATADMRLEGVDLGGFVSGGKRGRLEASSVADAPGLESVASLEDKKKVKTSNVRGVVANQDQKPNQPRKPIPNRIAYKDTAFKHWKPGMLLPSCRRCKNILQPEEHHECPGWRQGELEDGYLPIAPKGTEVLKKRTYTFEDYDEEGIPLEDKIAADEDDRSGYEDWDDDHHPALGAAAAPTGKGFDVEEAE